MTIPTKRLKNFATSRSSISVSFQQITFKLSNCNNFKTLFAMASTDFPHLALVKSWKNRGKVYWFQRPFWCCSTPRDSLCVMGPLGPSRIFQRMTWKNLVYSLTVSLSKSPTLLMNTTVSCCCQNLCSSCCLVLLTLLHYVIWSSHESETLKTLPKKPPVQILHNRFSSVRVLSCV